MDFSKNNGTPKSSILIHPFWGTPIFGNTHIQEVLTTQRFGINKQIEALHFSSFLCIPRVCFPEAAIPKLTKMNTFKDLSEPKEWKLPGLGVGWFSKEWTQQAVK